MDPSRGSLGLSPSSATPFMMRRNKDGGGTSTTNVKAQAVFGPQGNTEDKVRIGELVRQVEENNQQILVQKMEIGQLKQQIIRLVESHHSSVNPLIGVIGGQHSYVMPPVANNNQ